MASTSSLVALMFIVVLTTLLHTHLVHHMHVDAARSRGRSVNSATAVAVIEHPVFFNMAGLSDDPDSEAKILQGLNDLLYNNYSNIHFLYSGRALENKGVFITHALISRFPSIADLRVYYDYAIKEIASEMHPWLKKEYCVDYVAGMEEDAIMLNVTENMATHVTFIKVSSNVSDSDIEGAMDAFLGLALELDYAIQLTSGENIYMKEGYRTMSHAFSAYFASVDAMEKWQQESTVLLLFQDTILPLADSYAMVSLVPFVASNGVLHHVVQ